MSKTGKEEEGEERGIKEREREGREKAGEREESERWRVNPTMLKQTVGWAQREGAPSTTLPTHLLGNLPVHAQGTKGCVSVLGAVVWATNAVSSGG